MRDLPQEILTATATVEPDWTDAHALEIERRFVRRYRRRQSVRRAGKVLAVVALLGASGLGWLQLRARRAPEVASGATDPSLRFSDGSVATPIGLQSQLRGVTDRPELIEMSLARGGARLTVPPSSARLFRVQAGRVTYSTLYFVCCPANWRKADLSQQIQ